MSLNIQAQLFRTVIINTDTFFVLPDTMMFSFFNGDKTVKDSFPNGKWIELKKGRILCKFSLKNKLLNGDWLHYDTNSMLNQKVRYLNGVKVGPEFAYTDSGKELNLCYWDNGEQQEASFFYPDNNSKFRTITISDSLDFFTSYYENGMKESEGCRENDVDWETSRAITLKTGQWNYWYDNGNSKMVGFYCKDKKDSAWTYFNEQGGFIKSEFYQHGVMIKSSDTYEYDRTGILKGKRKK